MLHVDIPSRSDVQALLADLGPARVSIYLPTTPLTNEAQADRIALKNLATEAFGQLADHDKREVRAMEESIFDLIDDDDFWQFQANSLALFASPKGLRTFRLANRLTPVVEVSDRFYVKPLLRATTAPQTAFVLALSQNGVRVVQVAADLPAFEVRVDGMPKDAASAAGKSSIKDRSPSGRMQGSEGQKVRLAQYSRKIDHALRDLLGGRETPLILAATEPLLSIYAEVQTYPHLTSESIRGNPDETSDQDLAVAARTVLDGLFSGELAEIRESFDRLSSVGRTSQDVAQVARAATNGAVQTLLVDVDAVEPGFVDEVGAVQFAKGPCAKSHDLIDEIAARSLTSGARVLGVRAQDIPGGASLAAIYRYAF